MMIKKVFGSIWGFMEKYLLVRDLFNVTQWIVALMICSWVSVLLFGGVDAPQMTMGYLQRSFATVSAFSIYMAATWIMVRLFFGGIGAYFTRKSAEKGGYTFSDDLKFLSGFVSGGISYNNDYEKDFGLCLKRLLFHLGFYVVVLLAIILTGGMMF